MISKSGELIFEIMLNDIRNCRKFRMLSPIPCCRARRTLVNNPRAALIERPAWGTISESAC